eukprot:1857298-Pyramimonas_sp.AAC.1
MSHAVLSPPKTPMRWPGLFRVCLFTQAAAELRMYTSVSSPNVFGSSKTGLPQQRWLYFPAFNPSKACARCSADLISCSALSNRAPVAALASVPRFQSFLIVFLRNHAPAATLISCCDSRFPNRPYALTAL